MVDNAKALLGEQLIQDGVLRPEGLAQAVDHQRRAGGALEDALIGLKLVNERDLLKTLARPIGLQFVTTEKVRGLKIPESLLEAIPVRVAELHGVLPFRFDETRTLWALVKAALSADVAKELKELSGAQSVRVILARGATLNAAVRFHYYRDQTAFVGIDEPPMPKVQKAPAAGPEVASIEATPAEREPSRITRNPALSADDLSAENERLRVTMAFAASLSPALDFKKVVSGILDHLLQLMPTDIAGVILTDQYGQTQFAEFRAKDGTTVKDLELSDTLIAGVVESRRGVLTGDALVDERLARAESVVIRKLRAVMCVPMLSAEKVIGALYLEAGQVGAFERRHLELCRELAAQSALAIDQAMLVEDRGAVETRQHQLARFLPAGLLERVNKRSIRFEEAGHLFDGVAMAVHIPSFEKVLEGKAAVMVIQLLNELFELLADAVWSRGGLVERLTGGKLLAVWGTPVRTHIEIQQAVSCAVEIVQALTERRAAGFDVPAVGVGIAVGPLIGGLVGASRRQDFGAFGDAVEAALAISKLSRPDEIIASDQVRKGDKLYVWDALEDALERGQHLPERIFRLRR